MPDLPQRTPIAAAPLSVILLADRAAADLADVLAAWIRLLDELARPDAEILLVQQGDQVIPEAIARQFSRVRVIRQESAHGVGAALQTGLLAAQHPLVVIAPADKQFQPADLKRLLAEIDKVDLVTSYRVHRPVPAWLNALDFCCHWLARILVGNPTERRDCWLGWSGWGRRWAARWLFGIRVTDPECPFRLARRELFRRIPIQSAGPFAHTEILAKANHLGAWIAQVPVSWVPPKVGEPPGQARQMRAEAWRLFKNADFSQVALKEPLTWEATAFGSHRRYRMPKELGDFGLEFEICFERAVRFRMTQIGVPESMMGSVPGDPGAFSNRHGVGGTNSVPQRDQPYVPAINVDPAVLDVGLVGASAISSWKTASLRDRVDAVIAHEYEEALAPLTIDQLAFIQREGHVDEDTLDCRHRHAIQQGPYTKLKISTKARQILAEMRRPPRV